MDGVLEYNGDDIKRNQSTIQYLHLEKEISHIRETSIFTRPVETMKIVFWFNLALHGIQLGWYKIK